MAVTSGCLGLIGNSESSVVVGSVWLANNHSDEKDFQIVLERDGETVHDSTHTLSGDAREEADTSGETDTSSVMIECTWGSESDSYTLKARVDDNEWEEYHLNEEVDDDTECVVIDVWYAWRDVEEFTLITSSDCTNISDIEGGCAGAESNS
jgi:hypothetical protein